MTSLLFLLAFCLPFAPGDDESGLAPRYGFSGYEIYKAEWGVFDLAFHDLDGDGMQDFGFVNNTRSRMELYLRLSEDAADELDSSDPDALNEITYDGRFRKERLPVEQEVLGLALGRFDGDKIVDAAFITASSELIIDFRGRGRETIKLEDFKPQRGGLLGEDVDADGIDDVILLGEKKTLLVSLGLEPVVLHNVEPKPGSLILGDFDGDGLKDLLYIYYQGDYPFVVRFQDAPGLFGPAATWKLEPVRAFDVADTDRDGRDEIFAVYKNSGRLVRFALEESQTELFRFYSLRGLEDAEKISFSTADVDADGIDEVLIADAEAARVTLMDGLDMKEPVDVREFPSLRDVRDPRVGDLDGDGERELVVISETEGVIGISALGTSIAFPRFVAVEGKPLALDVGDVTGDGIDDAVCISLKGVGSKKEYFLTVLRKGDAGETVDSILIQKAKPTEKILAKDPRDLLLADVDRDGIDDVILFMPGEVPAILFGKKSVEGPFKTSMGGETPGLGILDGARAWTVCSADAGGDGVRELAAASGNLARFIFVPEGAKVPQAARQYNSPDPGDRFTGCAVADVVGDETLELILFEENTRTVRVVGEDDSLLVKLDAGRIDFRGIETPDLNGDGKADVLIKGKDRIAVWLAGQGGTAVKEAGTYESPDKETYLLDVAVGDVNADGEAEVVLIDSGQNSLFIVAMTEKGMQHALKFRVFEEKLFQGSRGGREPHSVKVRDLTGDGKEDVVILVHDKIIIYPQD